MKKVICTDASNSELTAGKAYWVEDTEDGYYTILLPKGLEDGFWFRHRFKDAAKEKVKKKEFTGTMTIKVNTSKYGEVKSIEQIPNDSIVESVIKQFKGRSEVGIKKSFKKYMKEVILILEIKVELKILL